MSYSNDLENKTKDPKTDLKCYRECCNETIDRTYFNKSTRQYYCKVCALKINYWAVTDEGISLFDALGMAVRKN
jgi:hypothetical protein